MRINAEVGFGVDFGLASGLLRACSGRKNRAQIMHTTRQFLYSKGKIHTSYFRKTECETARPAFVRVDNLVCNKGKDELLGGMCHMLRTESKAGYTLVEVLVVVAILGILSSLGVVGLQSAVANTRIKDAAYNVTAFMERTANEARRVNEKLCVKKISDQELVTYKSACDASPLGAVVDRFRLDAPLKFIGNEVTGAGFKDEDDNNLDNWSTTSGAEFEPKIGLSAAPTEGYFAVQYGGRGLYAAALKSKKKNNFAAMMKFDDSSWMGL